MPKTILSFVLCVKRCPNLNDNELKDKTQFVYSKSDFREIPAGWKMSRLSNVGLNSTERFRNFF